MRLLISAISATIAIGLTAGCAGNTSGPSASIPNVGAQYRAHSVWDDQAPPRVVSVLHSLVLPDKAKKLPKAGVYVTQFYGSDILGFAAVNKGNKPAICTVSGVTSVNDVGVDGAGNLMEPDGGTATLNIFQGPTMCGKNVGSISDSYGQPADASSANAMTGKIAVSNLESGTLPGSLTICTLAGGCTVQLTNSNIYHAGGVVMSPSGNCYLNVKTSSAGGADLLYFKKCAGKGVVASGFKSTYYGGMDMDNSGNLVVIDDMAENVYIYKGCNPKCTVVGGPFALKGESFFGKLSQDNSTFTAVDRTDAVVDVYTYSTKALKFSYSYTNGLEASETPDGVGVLPRSKM